MATIIDPPTPSSNLDSAIAVRPGQPLRLEANASTNWWLKTNGGAWVQINTVGVPTTVFVWTTPTTVTRRFTFDDLRVAANDTTPGGLFLGGLYLNLVEGPGVPYLATAAMDPESAPALDPNLEEHDDPPLGLPWAMAGADRTGFGTVRMESPPALGGPANLVAVYGPGVFIDTAGRAGVRTPIGRVRGLGPLPAIASYYHVGTYFHYDFGRARSLGLTRVLYEDSAGNIATVRGDGRRNTYRLNLSYRPAVGVKNTLTKDGSGYYETTPEGRIFVYSTAKALQKVVDRYGTAIYYTYDANSRLQKIEGLSSNSGLVPYLAYDGSGLCSMVVLEDGAAATNNRTTYFQYNGDRNLEKIIGPELCITYFEYNSPDALSAVTDPEGYRWYFAYDGSTRLSRIVDALGNAAYFTYDTATPRTSIIDRVANQIYFEYNAFGYPKWISNPGTPVDYFGYDYQGDLTASKNRLGNQWNYQYDTRGNRISVTDPLGARSYFAYDSQNLLKTAINALGRPTYYGYDASRNLTSVTDPAGKVAYYAYQTTGLAHFRKDRRANFTYYAFDGKANLTALVDALANITYFDYNSAGERTQTFDALSRATYFTFDKRGRLTQRKDAYLNTKSFAYDARCNLITEVDERAKSTYHTYDGNSNRTKTVRLMDDGSFLATYFRYDGEEQLAGEKDARLNETYWTYDVLGRRQKQVNALGDETYWAYDDAHEMEREVMPAQTAGGTRAASYYEYDLAGRRQRTKDAFFNVTYLGYDLAGNLVSAIDPLGQTTYHTYDVLERRIKTADPVGNFEYYVFDEEGNLARSVDKRGNATYFGYDGLNRQYARVDPALLRTYFDYDAVGNRIRIRLEQDETGTAWQNERVVTYFTFDKLNRSEKITGSFGTYGSVSLLTYHAYDAASNRVLLRREVLDGADRRSTYYDYDAVNRLVKLIDPGATDTSVRGYTYFDYDGVGNRTRVVDQEGRPTYFRYDAVNREDARWNALLDTSYIHYDGRGAVAKQVNGEGRTSYFDYDLLGRQTHQSNALGERTYFGYDARSSRVLSVNPRGYGTYFTFDALGRLTHRKDALTGIQYFGFDAVGNQVLRLDELLNPSYFTFDAGNRQTRSIDATGATTYITFDARDLLRERYDADGRKTYFAYDSGGRVTTQAFTTDPAMTYLYDVFSNMTNINDDTGKNKNINTYDKLERLTKKTTLGGAVYYSYDKTGLKATLKDPVLNQSYFGYDVAGRLAHVQLLDGTQRAQYYAYDRSGLPTRRSALGGCAVAYYTYESATGRLQQLENYYFRQDTGVLQLLSYFRYYRNSNGTIEKTTREGGLNLYYTFDALDRLTDEDRKTGASASFGMYYEYDAAANRKRKYDKVTANNPTTYYDYDSRNLLTKEHTINSATDRLTHYFVFDLSQRMNQDYVLSTTAANLAATYFTYNQRNMISRLEYNDNAGADAPQYFVFNGIGEHVGIKQHFPAPTAPVFAYWAYDGRKPILEKEVTTPAGLTTYFRHNESALDPMGSCFEIRNSSAQHGAPLYDERGSVIDVGCQVESYEYDFFGNQLPGAVEAISQSLGFRTPEMIRLDGTELYYLARGGSVYVPRLARSTSTLLSAGAVAPYRRKLCRPESLSGAVGGCDRLSTSLGTARRADPLTSDFPWERQVGCEELGIGAGFKTAADWYRMGKVELDNWIDEVEQRARKQAKELADLWCQLMGYSGCAGSYVKIRQRFRWDPRGSTISLLIIVQYAGGCV